MRRRPTARPQRRPVFLGCEGESERGYGTLIGRLRDELRRDLHLDVTLLRPGGGDPLALVETACQKIAHTERNRDIRYSVRAILLDSDKLSQSPARDQKHASHRASRGPGPALARTISRSPVASAP
jgi:hypothetical protein